MRVLPSGSRGLLLELDLSHNAIAAVESGAFRGLANHLRSPPAPLPLVESKIRDETGELRRHVNAFVDGHDVKRDAGTRTTLRDGATVIVLSAVSGG